MSREVVACCLAVLALLLLDAGWLILAGTGRRFMDMAKGLGPLRPWSPWQLAVFVTAAYALLALAICRFAVLPSESRVDAAVSGALLGLIIYGVYDATNLSIFGRSYGLGLAASDVAWGTFALGLSSYVGSWWLLR